MKAYSILFLLLLAFCGQKKDAQNTDTSNVYLPNIVDANSKTIKRNPILMKSNLEVDSIIKGLNLHYPNVKLEILKQSNDTLYTFIKNSYYLGEKMGSSGVADYFANTILNITQIPTIRFVNLALDEGSHVASGVWGG